MKDVAILFDIMAGADRYDNSTFDALSYYPKAGYSAEVVSKDALRGMKLGLPWNPYWSTISVSRLDRPEEKLLTNELVHQLSWSARAVREASEGAESSRSRDLQHYSTFIDNSVHSEFLLTQSSTSQVFKISPAATDLVSPQMLPQSTVS